jgi:hypothetical protein
VLHIFFLSLKSGKEFRKRRWEKTPRNSEELVRLNRCGLGTGWSQGQGLLAFASLVTIGAIALWLGPSTGQARLAGTHSIAQPTLFVPEAAPSAHGPPQIRVAYNHLPLIFEPNHGQTDPQVKFLARGSGYGLFLTAEEAVLALQHPAVNTSQSAHRVSLIRMALDGAK